MATLMFRRLRCDSGMRDGKLVASRAPSTAPMHDLGAQGVARMTTRGFNVGQGAMLLRDGLLYCLDMAFAHHYERVMVELEQDILAAMPPCGGVLVGVLYVKGRVANDRFRQVLRANVYGAGLDYEPLVERHLRHQMSPAEQKWGEDLYWVTPGGHGVEAIPARSNDSFSRHHEQQDRALLQRLMAQAATSK